MQIPVLNLPRPVPPERERQPQDSIPQTRPERERMKLQARAYELTGPAAGLDIAQRWRPAADTVFFWKQHWFVVIRWQEADRRALQEFTSALEKRLNGK